MREALRDATDTAHARVDAAFSRFRLEDAPEREAFLRAQSAGLAAALGALADEPEWAAVVRARIAATGHACAPLGNLRGQHPLGVAYVVAGSLHGTSVLRGQLLRARVTPPPFFEGAEWKPMWADVLSRLDASDPASLPALVSAATATFDAFHAAALAQAGVPA